MAALSGLQANDDEEDDDEEEEEEEKAEEKTSIKKHIKQYCHFLVLLGVWRLAFWRLGSSALGRRPSRHTCACALSTGRLILSSTSRRPSRHTETDPLDTHEANFIVMCSTCLVEMTVCPKSQQNLRHHAAVAQRLLPGS